MINQALLIGVYLLSLANASPLVTRATTTKVTKKKKKKKISAGLIAAIVVIVVVLIILAFIAFLVYKRLQKKKAAKGENVPMNKPSSLALLLLALHLLKAAPRTVTINPQPIDATSPTRLCSRC
ncbi:Pre-mRNA-processing-splicing factor 8 [Venturia inaequalis]|nr:Pre-mRNA-processing-splicing factor 8 [Venturia inaequalis]